MKNKYYEKQIWEYFSFISYPIDFQSIHIPNKQNHKYSFVGIYLQQVHNDEIKWPEFSSLPTQVKIQMFLHFKKKKKKTISKYKYAAALFFYLVITIHLSLPKLILWYSLCLRRRYLPAYPDPPLAARNNNALVLVGFRLQFVSKLARW